jgi:hypothetical protein
MSNGMDATRESARRRKKERTTLPHTVITSIVYATLKNADTERPTLFPFFLKYSAGAAKIRPGNIQSPIRKTPAMIMTIP